jgi:predicted AAA+ superfamily ATPase
MKRFLEMTLAAWGKKQKPLPLMLIGARQTGKTYLLKNFCSTCFEQSFYLNFAENHDYVRFFQSGLRPEVILGQMELFFNRKFDVGKTVFFFDEIQDCEEAIASLKYFAESEQDYRIVTAGSLLGVKINRMKASFPVGKVQLEYLYPMDFEEFLWAMDEQLLATEIRRCYMANASLPEIIHQKALTLYRSYLCIGGMPAVVDEFVKNAKDLALLNRGIAANILTGYLADMVKYADRNNAVKIHQVYNSIPAQLAKANTKFMYKLVEQGGNKEKYKTSIEWLLEANMLLSCIRINLPQSPLRAYRTDNHFKLYLSDVGLLVSLARIHFNEIMQPSTMMFRGFLTENYVAQSLLAKGMELHFWESGNQAEVDFILHLHNGIIPVEVKASDHVRSKSLQSYMAKYHPAYAIRISALNFGFVGGIKSVPLYAVHCIQCSNI